MGEAKRRGTYEQRVTEGIRKREEEEEMRKRRAAAREAMLTPAERRKRHELRTLIASTAGLVGGLNSFTKRRS